MIEKLKLDALRKAISSLSDSLDIVSDRPWFTQQSTKLQNTLMAGVIQNFEFVYEISIKMIKRQIEMESPGSQEVDHTSFRDVLRFAAEKGLIADIEVWFEYREMRNITAHTYDHEKARLVYGKTLGFMIDARALLEHLEVRNA